MQEEITFKQAENLPAELEGYLRCSKCSTLVKSEKSKKEHLRFHKLRTKIDKNLTIIKKLELENEVLELRIRCPGVTHWSEKK